MASAVVDFAVDVSIDVTSFFNGSLESPELGKRVVAAAAHAIGAAVATGGLMVVTASLGPCIQVGIVVLGAVVAGEVAERIAVRVLELILAKSKDAGSHGAYSLHGGEQAAAIHVIYSDHVPELVAA